MNLSPEAVLALAPDDTSARNASDIAVARRWLSLGAADDAVWGEIRSTAQYKTGVALGESGPAFTCSCPSSKRPCKHALALLLLHARDPGVFPRGDVPGWLELWMRQRDGQASRKAARGGAVADPQAQARRIEDREARIAAGLDDLERWMRDLVRQGLASVHGRGYEVWDAPAARLVDAQAPGLARRVRALAGVAASGPGWPARLVERLGLLYLLVRAYRGRAELPDDLRADVRALVGWTVNQDELLAGPGIDDRWLILGERLEEDERFRSQRLWLAGKDSRRFALLLDFAPAGAPLDRALRPGHTLDGELVFFPGAVPQRALVKLRRGVIPGVDGPPAHPDLVAAHGEYAANLEKNPWLEEQPFALRAAVPQRLDDAWVIRDAAGHMVPLSRRFSGELRLHAVAGGRPVALFGEWNGRSVTPLAAHAEGRLVALA